jgi:hypothetical protein
MTTAVSAAAIGKMFGSKIIQTREKIRYCGCLICCGNIIAIFAIIELAEENM